MLDRTEAARAFPLVRSALGVDSIGSWLDMLDRPAAAGVMIVEDERGCVVALFRFRPVDEPPHGRTLVCDQFAVGELLRSARPLHLLLEAAERLASTHGCARIVLDDWFRPPDAPDVAGTAFCGSLHAAGYRMESLRFSKSAAALASGMLSRGD